MCNVSDLVVMVVEPDTTELEKACDSLNVLGIDKILCVSSFQEAIDYLKTDNQIDIVLADYAIEEGKDLGTLLVTVIKKDHPGILVILTSKDYTCSVVLNSIKMNADDILDKNRENDINQLMPKWITLAKLKNETREILHGKRELDNQ